MAAGDYYVNGLKVTADGALYVNASVAGLDDATDVTKGDALVAVKRQVVGSVASTVHNWIEGQVLNVKTDFGAVGDGVTDDTTAFTTAAASGSPYVPAGSYKITGTVTGNFWTVGTVTIVGGTVNYVSNIDSLASPSGSSLVGFLQSGTGAVATTTQAELRRTWWVEQFGATGDGTTDDAAAIQAAVTALDTAGGGILKGRRSKTYGIKAPITVPYTVGLEDIHLKALTGYVEQSDDNYSTSSAYGKKGMFNIYAASAGTGNANIAARNVWIDGNSIADTGLKDYVSVGRMFDTVYVTGCTAHNVRLMGSQNNVFNLLNTNSSVGGSCLTIDTGTQSNVFIRPEINLSDNACLYGVLCQASLPSISGVGTGIDNTMYYPLVERDRTSALALVKMTAGTLRIRGGNLSTNSGTSTDKLPYLLDKDTSVVSVAILLVLDGVSHVTDTAATHVFNIVDTAEVYYRGCSFSGATTYLASIDDGSHMYDLGGNTYPTFDTGILNPTGVLTAPSLMPGKVQYSRYDWQSFGATDYGFRTLEAGDTVPRSAFRGDGALVFGSGSAAVDVIITRIAADHAGTASGDSWRIGGALTQTLHTKTSSGGAVTLDYGFNGITLSENITSITPPASAEGAELTVIFLQAASGGPYTVAFPSGSFLLAGGSYTMTSTASKRDILVFKWWVNRWVELSRSQNM